MIMRFLDKLFGYIGYYRDEYHDEIRQLYLQQTMECRALINSLGYLQRESEEQNLLLTALITAQGQEEISLTKEYITDILQKRTETMIGTDDNGDVKLIVQLKEMM